MSEQAILKIPQAFWTTQYNPVIVQGDTIPRFLFKDITNLNLTGATIRMQLYQSFSKIFDVSSGAGITIINATSFEIDEVPFEENNFPVGTLTGDIEITLANGQRATVMKVEFTTLKHYTI